jgi:uncharacterized integral membrane protein
MYVIKNNKKVPIKIDEESIVEGFSWTADWPLVVGISLAVIFVILLIIFLATMHGKPAGKKSGTKSRSARSYRSRSRSGF